MITGATSGIGVAVIREFLSLYSGCYFILVSRNRKRMRERIESDSDIKDRIRYEIVETDLCDLHKSEEILEPRIREKDVWIFLSMLQAVSYPNLLSRRKRRTFISW